MKHHINALFIKLERRLHPKIKEGIAKSLVYYFTIKEINEYKKTKYQGHPHALDPFQDKLNIAHRGFSGEYPENTLLAFQKSLDQGVDMIELDVQLTLDGQIVVCHDPHLGRLTGVAHFIRDLSYQALCAYDVGSWKSTDFKGLKIPTLTEVFEIVPESTLINIEIKHEATSFFNWKTEKAVLEKIASHDRENQVVISAFNPMTVNRIRKLSPKVSTAYLITQTLNPFLIFLLAQIQSRYIHVDTRYLTQKIVQKLKDKGVQTLGYTLNSPEEYQTAYGLNLKGIFTDYPNRLKEFFRTHRQV